VFLSNGTERRAGIAGYLTILKSEGLQGQKNIRISTAVPGVPEQVGAQHKNPLFTGVKGRLSGDE
jgi:hypothetical protein